MAGLSLTQLNYPVYASEPTVTEVGHRTRLISKNDYAEIKSGNPIQGKRYDFQPMSFQDSEQASLDLCALLCMGTTPQTVPSKYLDRTLTELTTTTASFDGRVSYTCSGKGYERSSLVFYTVRPIGEGLDGSELRIFVGPLLTSVAEVLEGNVSLSVTVNNSYQGLITEETVDLSVTVNGLNSSSILEENPDTISVTVNGSYIATLTEG